MREALRGALLSVLFFARKAMCRSLAGEVLALTGGAGFFQALKKWVPKAGKAALKQGLYWGGVLITLDIYLYYEECPDFWEALLTHTPITHTPKGSSQCRLPERTSPLPATAGRSVCCCRVGCSKIRSASLAGR